MLANWNKKGDAKIPGVWLWWFLPKTPLIAAILYAAYQLGVTRQFPPSLEQAVRDIFLMVGGWLTSEAVDIIVNKWKERQALEQLKSGLKTFEEDLNARLDQLRSHWGDTPELDVDSAVTAIDKAINRGLTRPREVRITHIFSHPAISKLHERLEPCLRSGSVGMDYQHFHLWKASTDCTFQALERYTQAHKEDDHCLINCLRREADTLNLELVLVDEREAFVILPPDGSRKDSCTAYHLTGRSVVQPLVELYKQWWSSDSDEIKDPYQVFEQELKEFYEEMFPPPVQAPDPTEMVPPLAQAAGLAVEELEEDEFWTGLTQALRDLAKSQKRSDISEVRLSHAISLDRQEECDAAIVEALDSGKVRSYRRTQVVMTENEVSRLEAFIAEHNREKNHNYKAMSVSVSVKPSQHYLDPWTFWLLEPGKVVYLWCPGDNGSLSSCCSLVIREPSLVKGFRACFNTWWANRPQHVTIYSGPACDQGAFKKESFGTWRRHLTG